MKILTLLTALCLACFTLRSDAADATIANAPGGAITTVPDAYRMPWENPAVQGYYITFANLTNQVLAGIANQSYANSAASAVTNGYSWTNLPAISIAASNVTSGGVLPAGTVSSTALTSGYALGNNGSVRIWTNMLNGVSIGGNAVSATTAGSATNVVAGGSVSTANINSSGTFTNSGYTQLGGDLMVIGANLRMANNNGFISSGMNWNLQGNSGTIGNGTMTIFGAKFASTGITTTNSLSVAGTLTATNGNFFPQGTNTAPTATFIGGTVGSVTNHLMKNVGGALIDYWSDGTTLYSKQIAP